MIIAANWKMNMSFKQARGFLSRFNFLLKNTKEREQFLFFPPACLSFLFQKENLYWGGQNVSYKIQGPLTGETSAQTLKELGAGFCLLGHSERRYIFGESDSDIEKKFHILQELALIPILCIGESFDKRSEKEKFLKKQLSWIKTYEKYQNLPWKPEQLPPVFKQIPFIIAYEPLWSIGTGETPSTEEVNETSQLIKEYLPFPSTKVFYGGSLDQNTVKKFLNCPFIDGFLIGGASLDPDLLYNIHQQCNG